MSYLSELRAALGTRPLFSVGASATVQDETRRVLLQRRGDDGLWGLPGGGLELGETFEGAARRELNEETGLDTLLTFWQAVSGPHLYHRYPNGDQVYFVGGLCRGHLPAAALAQAAPDDSGETLELAWFDLAELPVISANVNKQTLSLLRSEVGLPPLPLDWVPPKPTGEHLRELRAVVGPRPLFAPGANVLLRDERGRVLLLRSADTRRWTLPGGSMELGETFEQAARRELREETGLEVGELRPLKLYIGPEYRFTYPHGDVVDNVSQLFEGQFMGGALTLPADEITEAAWFALGQLPSAEELSGPLIKAHLREWV
ncbi:NUDIX domain-containing protein [Deinococcus detaillensis]|uniref:NUDIX domain-containing protein n=1 Tax=Deinococcus detaillensis TaxID=2592048 RepID=A0A553V2X9_9DEIO|nr:NUDIX domain-containing protein [Deinococcus detaillensis]TSA86833.1 NUDIX domain-containing protein [Deinococcus detaillensis]